MEMADWQPETQAAVGAVRQALELAAQGTGSIHTKSGRDVVTDSDVIIEDRLRESLQSSFGWPVIGEERGGMVPDNGPHWLVDPICGTRNYASGIPLFSINVALVNDGEVAASAVGDGSTGDILVAEVGGGAWVLHGLDRRRLETSDESQTIDFEAWPRPGGERDRAAQSMAKAISSDRWDIRCFSSTLSLAYVAAGRLAGCVLFAAPAKVHVAAGTLLVSESGGSVSDTDGQPWTLESSSIVCCAGRATHTELIELLAT